jgi:hypothetical protein
MRWVRHAGWMGKMGNAYNILVVKLEGKDHFQALGVDERIQLE